MQILSVILANKHIVLACKLKFIYVASYSSLAFPGLFTLQIAAAYGVVLPDGSIEHNSKCILHGIPEKSRANNLTTLAFIAASAS